MSRTFRAIPRWAKHDSWNSTNPVYSRQQASYLRGDDRGPINHICGSVKVEVVGPSIVQKLNGFDDVSAREFKRDTARVARRTVRQNLRALADEALAEAEEIALLEAADRAYEAEVADAYEEAYPREMFEEDLFVDPPFEIEEADFGPDYFYLDDPYGIDDHLADTEITLMLGDPRDGRASLVQPGDFEAETGSHYAFDRRLEGTKTLAEVLEDEMRRRGIKVRETV